MIEISIKDGQGVPVYPAPDCSELRRKLEAIDFDAIVARGYRASPDADAEFERWLIGGGGAGKASREDYTAALVGYLRYGTWPSYDLMAVGASAHGGFFIDPDWVDQLDMQVGGEYRIVAVTAERAGIVRAIVKPREAA